MLLVDCGATAYIVTDKSKFTSFDNSFKPEQHYIELANGTKANNIARGRRGVRVSTINADGVRINAVLKNALYIIRHNLRTYFQCKQRLKRVPVFSSTQVLLSSVETIQGSI